MCKIFLCVCCRTPAISILLSLISLSAKTQDSLILENVQYESSWYSGSIQVGKQVKGYYFFYLSEKKSSTYTAQVIDENLKLVKKVVFPFDKNEKLLDAMFDGKMFICFLLNEKSKIVSNKFYNAEGKMVISYSRTLDKNSMYYFKDNILNSISYGRGHRYLFPIQNQGYFSIIPLKHGNIFSYEIDIYSNDGTTQHTYIPNEGTKLEKSTYIGASDNLLFFSILSKKILVDNKYESWILAVSIKDGIKKFLVPTITDQYQYYPISASPIGNENKIVIHGTYFRKEDKIQKAYSLGMCALIMDNGGLITNEKFNNWEKDFSQYVALVDTGGENDIGRLFIHDFIKTSSGRIFAVAEGYKRTANGLGILRNVLTIATGLGGINDNSKLAITDMVLVEFDSAFSIKDATIFSKKPHNALTFENDFVSTQILAVRAKVAGSFDYGFTQTDSTTQNFLVGYYDYEKSREKKGGTFNTIEYSDGKTKADRFDLSAESDFNWILPAKSGFALKTEYYEKEKILKLRLQPLNSKAL